MCVVLYCVCQEKVLVKQGSWFEPLRDDEGEFVGLVSNPPYIPSKDIGGLQAEVARHEPRLALDGGVSGMNDLIHLCDGTVSMLKPGGFFAFEVTNHSYPESSFLDDYLLFHVLPVTLLIHNENLYELPYHNVFPLLPEGSPLYVSMI